MKVFEKLNELKGTTCDLETIADWFYANRYYPLDILTINALKLESDVKLPENLKNVLREYNPKVFVNGMKPLIEMLNIELETKEELKELEEMELLRDDVHFLGVNLKVNEIIFKDKINELIENQNKIIKELKANKEQ